MIEPRGTAGQGRARRPGPTVRLAPGWLPESHLLPDAVVAFVDGELSAAAQERAALHLMRCTSCAADVQAQRQVSAAFHASNTPTVPAGLLASLQSIPATTELSTMPDNLAVDENGQVVAVQRPVPPMGSSRPLGSNGMSRRAVQGAGVVMSGLVLGALALALGVEDDAPEKKDPASQVLRLGVTQP